MGGIFQMSLDINMDISVPQGDVDFSQLCLNVLEGKSREKVQRLNLLTVATTTLGTKVN